MDEKVVMHREQLVSKCRDYINMICEKCGRKGLGRRPLNIAIVGAQGCGKSSFINSLAASLSQDTWIEYAMTGYRDGVNPVTNYISQYPECCNGDRQMYKTVLLPTLIDIPGPLDNDVDHRRKKFLQLLFYGHVKNSAAATQVYADCDRRWNDLLEKYFMVYSDMKVDRVIFVASAANERLPHSLMKCVMDAARPPPFRGLKRQIPVYGVLTSLDKVDDTNKQQFETNREEFMKALGLHEGRLLCCSNYCDLTDPNKERFRNILPSLDLPILEFFVQVCERKVHTVHDDDKMVDLRTQLRGVWRKLGSTWQPVVFSLALAIFAFILMYIVHAAFFTSEQDILLKERGDNDDQNIRNLSKVLQSTSSFRIAIVTALVTFVIAMRCHFD